ncbi:MAG: sulfatase-like hydrolase/transferase [Legionellales bacterium]
MSPSRLFAHRFLYFLALNLCFFIIQIYLIYADIGNNLVSTMKLPHGIYLEFLMTLSYHLGLYLLLSLIQTLLLWGILKRSWHYLSPDKWQVVIWSLCACAILSANTYYFPLSIISRLCAIPASTPYAMHLLGAKELLILSGSALIFLSLNSLLFRKPLLVLLAITPIVFGATLINQHMQPIPCLKPSVQPNILLLSIDSLSPESINKDSMPFVYKKLQDSVQFKNAISPLARTTPAWCSIVTGLYAKHHHADENLIDRAAVAGNSSIVWNLNKQGYTSLFATDDRRFDNVNTSWGFSKIIGPKEGFNDFLIGTYNDFPLSNLLINFRISAPFFPYNYINRASFFSYYPESFSEKLQRELALQQQNCSPVFLAVHFALAHWPYSWAESLPDKTDNQFSLENRDFLYQKALKRVDQQFETLFAYLQQHDYMTNSLVVILSDHGEVLYFPNSRLTNYLNYQGTLPSKLDTYFKNKTGTVLDKSAGHGSDLLSPKQYHSVLAFNIYKNKQAITKPAQITTRVALIDIAPTILAFLKTENPQTMDGISVLPSILNPSLSPSNRAFFIESGMQPNQVVDAMKAREIAKKSYTINPHTLNIEIKNSALKSINNQKLYGIIKDNWVLALYPDDAAYIAVIQNLSTGQWIDNLDTKFAQSTPAAALAKQVQQFYGNKLTFPIPHQ